jgi:hypothetical protein
LTKSQKCDIIYTSKGERKTPKYKEKNMINYNVNYKVEGYTNKWSVIDDLNGYVLLENNTWGDETCYLVAKQDQPTPNNAIMEVAGETYDDLETALEDLEL